ncbi:MAG: YqeG family HAD IIIA-type phosphatase [Ruminiclostridium sp.]|nr:YqeG family HAD IIIA-type phosphatase [Ruminiclostridium sp.]
MLEKFFPDVILDKVQDISIEKLDKNNIKGLILDIDNTLVPEHMKEADENAVKWIERIKGAGFKLCIVSNASKKRVIKFNERLQLYAIHRASKPGTTAFEKAGRLMDFKNENIAVVGDQIFTDIYGGNRVGMFTILVTPIHKKESLFIMLKRLPEKLVLRSYYKKKKK